MYIKIMLGFFYFILATHEMKHAMVNVLDWNNKVDFNAKDLKYIKQEQ